MSVCKIEDDFILERLRWVITLSNNEVILQDDDRPGESEPIAWLRLREYIYDNKLAIVKFQIQFCSHIEEAVPANASGYYFTRKVGAFAFTGQANSTYNYYVVGVIGDDGKVYTTEWMVPEIIVVGHDVRDVAKDDQRLIINHINRESEAKIVEGTN